MKAWGALSLATVIVITIVAFVVLLVLFPVFAGYVRIVPPKTVCLSNVKDGAVALAMYTSDNNDRLPAAWNWYDAAGLYTYEALLCPVVARSAVGYAFDSRLSLAKTNEFSSPNKRRMIYDSTSLARNAADPMTSLPVPGRHNRFNNIGFVDGHAKSIRDPQR